MKKYLKYLVINLIILCNGSVHSTAQRFPFFNLKIENGLAQSQTTCMTQDSFGNLWIGTLGGVSRYDGRKFSNYSVNDGLLSNTVYDLKFDHKGKLIISTSEGLQQFDGKHFLTLANAIKNNNQYTAANICISKSNKIYYLVDGKICTTDDAKPNVLNGRDILFSTMQQSNGLFYAADRKGMLYVFNDDDFSKAIDSAVNTQQQLLILKIYEDHKHNIWTLTNMGLFLKHGTKLESYMPKNKLQQITFPLLSAAEDDNGQLWLGCISGAFCIKDSAVRYFNQQHGLSNNIIYSIIKDKEGNVWFGSDGQGIFRYSGGPFISIDETFGLVDKQVTSISGDEKSNIYFATYSGRLSKYTWGGKVTLLDIPELKNVAVSGIAMQNNKGLWIGTRGKGLFCYTKGRLKHIPIEALGTDAATVNTLFVDHKDRLWAGLSKDVLYLGNDHPHLISLSGAVVLGFAEIGQDSILIATNKGFVVYHNNQINNWNKGKITDSLIIQCLCAKNGNLYIGTGDKGIVKYNIKDGSYQTFNKRNGLGSDFIYNITVDSAGNIWAGTGLGICKISIDKNGKNIINNYGKANGIVGLESNANAVYQTGDGHIWFGTTEGVSCFMPNAVTTVAQPLSIVLESIKLFGGKEVDSNYYSESSDWYHIPQNLVLPYRQNNLSFSFQAITLSPVDKIWYRYKLLGTDAPWSEWSTDNAVNFSSLEPGSYTLLIECSISEHRKTDASLSYSFVIKTPFHKTIWFVMCIFIGAILLGVYLQYAANKRKQQRLKRENELRREEQNRVRERTAEDFHDEVGNKLTRINILTNVLKSKIETGNTDAERIITQIQDNTQQLYNGTRDILWSLQPANDNLYEITNHVRDLANELFADTNIQFVLSGNDIRYKDYKMPLDKSRNFIMIWKEALNNCMKYAGARNVSLQIQQINETRLQIRLTDDGIGFNKDSSKMGNGLKNMQARAKRMDGELTITSAEDNGTQICLTLHNFLPLSNTP